MAAAAGVDGAVNRYRTKSAPICDLEKSPAYPEGRTAHHAPCMPWQYGSAAGPQPAPVHPYACINTHRAPLRGAGGLKKGEGEGLRPKPTRDARDGAEGAHRHPEPAGGNRVPEDGDGDWPHGALRPAYQHEPGEHDALVGGPAGEKEQRHGAGDAARRDVDAKGIVILVPAAGQKP